MHHEDEHDDITGIIYYPLVAIAIAITLAWALVLGYALGYAIVKFVEWLVG